METPKQHDVVWDEQKIADYWNIWGNLKPKSPWFGEKAGTWIRKEVEELRPHFSGKSPKVLDIGCGSGVLLHKTFAPMGFDCYGVDLSPERMERARRDYPEMTFAVGSMKSSPFPDDTFDLVVSTQMVEHLLDDDLEPSFAEMSRLVKPGGLVMITTRYDEDMSQGHNVCPDCHAVYRYSQHLQSFDIPRMTALLEGVGLSPLIVKRSRCRDHLRDMIPQRRIPLVRHLGPLLYWLFADKLDREMGKYLYAVGKKE